MNEMQRSVLGHVAATLFGAPALEEPLTSEVLEEAAHQGVLGLMPIEGSIQYWQMLRRNVMVVAAHQKLHKLMTENGIPYVVLKGVASAAYYPDPDRRLMGDVDFIVKEPDFERTCSVLDAEGFEGHKDMQEHHIRYNTGSGWWELHWRAPGFPENHPIERFVDEMIDQAQACDGCMSTSPFHHGLILLTHSASHWITSGVTLRHICDWAVFYAHFEEAEFLSMFEVTLKELGLWRYAQLLTAVCMRYLGAPARCWAENADENLLAALIEDVFDVDEERVNEAKLMTDDSSVTVDDTAMHVKFIRTLAHKACLRWPICARIKLLLPFGMIGHLIVYSVKVLQGKKPQVHLSKMISGAKKRKGMFQQFELFQTK